MALCCAGAERDLYNAGARRPSQAPRGPASHGGAYGSGYGDPFGGGFGTPRARSGWSNFRYQQRQYSRHGAGRTLAYPMAVVRSITTTHFTVEKGARHVLVSEPLNGHAVQASVQGHGSDRLTCSAVLLRASLHAWCTQAWSAQRPGMSGARRPGVRVIFHRPGLTLTSRSRAADACSAASTPRRRHARKMAAGMHADGKALTACVSRRRLVLPALCRGSARPGPRRRRLAHGAGRRAAAGLPGARAARRLNLGEPQLWVTCPGWQRRVSSAI